ncbi:DUF3604 domain-containing protein [Robiginitalea sp. SC105]|uniref:DUF3604 domain-containing protein n=1 Tax=Robiginitalea sp. SC105 TaxID=2762332 RepID=UPI00163A4D1B|nr:DUF3604 domain-containing protein [Robiginitalea sp. SC105]MBC2838858.1 DUF3604 domain-containing protein [Robiginitalea sp. SC105]
MIKQNFTRIFLISFLFLFTGCGEDKKPEASDGAMTGSEGTPGVVSINPNKDVFFGNLHVHTKWSFDAFINGAASGPEEAYRWAKGETIPGGGDGTPLKIKTPLDWYVVADHAEFMGALPMMNDPNSAASKHPLAADIIGDDPVKSFNAYTAILDDISNRRNDSILGSPELQRSVWSDIVSIADQHYAPGSFTTFAGYEWTSNPDWQNLHRIVLFRDTDHVPELPFSAIDSDVPERLWEWMDNQRQSGNEVLAIPHNGNASDGLMFPEEKSYGGSAINKEYASTRMRNEPVYELTQIKGTSETHPELSPNDEFASFELWDYTLASTATPPENKKGGYMREALIRSLKYDMEGKGNPFKYGFIGDSDTHNSASPVEEDNYSGKFGFENDPKHRLDGPPGVSEAAAKQVREFSSAGIAAVWAVSNTREAIFEAIKNKETYATSGPRMKVRFFAGYDYPENLLDMSGWLETAYASGVPMGGDLSPASDGKVPVFAIQAVKEADGANLDRIQVIKGWVDAGGATHEKIYNVALSDNRMADAAGNVPAVGNTVDAANASYTNDIGDVELMALWSDPDFDPAQHAVYYVRVLQIPTPRWSTYDAKTLGRQPREDLPVSIQERAWSSPIWYNPN